MSQQVYKIVSATAWQKAQADGEFRGAGVDLEDGFIHLSTAEQVQETADLHFAGQSDLLLVSVPTDDFGEELRWEASRGGALFPHLYGKIRIDQITSADPIHQDKSGRCLIDLGPVSE